MQRIPMLAAGSLGLPGCSSCFAICLGAVAAVLQKGLAVGPGSSWAAWPQDLQGQRESPAPSQPHCMQPPGL